MNIYPSPLHRRCGTNEHQPLNDEELFHLTMQVYFEFRLAFIDHPDVRLHTQEGRSPQLIQVVLDQWVWDPPLVGAPVTAEEFHFNDTCHYLVDSPTGNLDNITYHTPRQWFGAIELDLKICAARPSTVPQAAKHFHRHFIQKQQSLL